MNDTPAHEVPASTAAERNYGAAAHLAPFVGGLVPVLGSFVVTLAVWWLKRESVYVDRHARASLNFQLSMLIYYGLGIGYVYVYSVFGLTLLVSSALLETVSVLAAARRAKAGQYYEYRMCLTFVKMRDEGGEA